MPLTEIDVTSPPRHYANYWRDREAARAAAPPPPPWPAIDPGLTLDGPPTSACHRITGSLHASVTRADTPWPHRPATAASRACAT